MSVLSQKHFHNEKAAFRYLETVLWPDGPICPHCGTVGRARPLKGKAHRIGLWKCYEKECRKQFTVKVGTVFEHGRIPLHKMLQAVHLLTSSKKGISAHQLHRTLEITYKTAWFLAHRIREAMRPGGNLPPLGGPDKIVEADETYIGKSKGSRSRHTFVTGKGWIESRPGHANKYKIISLVERGGRAKSVHVRFLTANTARDTLVRNVDRKSKLMTDESNIYKAVGTEYASHGSVNHSLAEYGRGLIHTNTIEGFFSIFKRGIYQHCGEQHLHRYLAEFDFRYSERKVSDSERTVTALGGIAGKRLTYRRTGVQAI